MRFDQYTSRSMAVTAILVLVVFASGCVSSSSASLDQDFDTEAVPADTNRTGESLLNETFSGETGEYDVNSKTRLLFNTPVTSIRMNLSSEGEFRTKSSEVRTVTRIGLGLTNASESPEWPEKTVRTEGNRSEITVRSGENTTTRTAEAYSREELGISMEAFESIDARDVELLGASGENSSLLILKIDAESSDLVENYKTIMEAHAVNEESSSMEQEDRGFSGFNRSKTYAWIDRGDMSLERYSYFGSTAGGTAQVRVDARFGEEK